jgi:hypothetical protein
MEGFNIGHAMSLARNVSIVAYVHCTHLDLLFCQDSPDLHRRVLGRMYQLGRTRLSCLPIFLRQ